MQQMQIPQGVQIDPRGLQRGEPGPLLVSPERYAVLEGYAERAPDLWQRMLEHGRRDIVAPAYARAQREWDDRIRPRYLDALDEAAAAARAAAEQAEAAAASEPEDGEAARRRAAELRAAAGQMEGKRRDLAAITLRHDARVDEALGSDWWQTVVSRAAVRR
jgi:hypothetical protein